MIDLVSSNLVWIVVIGVFVAMHLRGRGCGSHSHNSRSHDSHAHGGDHPAERQGTDGAR